MNAKQTILAGFLASSALLFGIAHAQGMGGMSGMSGPMQGKGMRGGMQGMEPGAMAERHLERLKGELKITAQQEPLWSAYAEKAKASMGKRPDMSGDEKLTAPERMAKMQAHMKEHLAAMESVHEAFKRLYDGLSAEQKAAADKHYARMGGRMKGGMGGMGGPGGKAGGPQGQAPAQNHSHG